VQANDTHRLPIVQQRMPSPPPFMCASFTILHTMQVLTIDRASERWIAIDVSNLSLRRINSNDDGSSCSSSSCRESGGHLAIKTSIVRFIVRIID
jgi:hypothetical protein